MNKQEKSSAFSYMTFLIFRDFEQTLILGLSLIRPGTLYRYISLTFPTLF